MAPSMSNESSSSAGHAPNYGGAAMTSPTLAPVMSRDTMDEEDLLSSGQVSPIS